LPTITAPASRSATTLAPVALGAAAGEERRALAGRHVDGLDDVLDADRHAVELRDRLARAPARGRLVGAGARAIDIEMHEGTDLGLVRPEIGEAALEEVARRIAAAREARRRRQVGFWREFQLVFRRQHGLCPPRTLRVMAGLVPAIHVFAAST